MFNFSEDEDSVTEDELKTILLSALQSAHTILDSVQGDNITETKESEKPLIVTVAEIVENAFNTCDKSKNGKLSAKEFSTWLHKNPQIMDNVFGWQCPTPELGQWANEPESLLLEGVDLGAEEGSKKSLQDLFSDKGSQNVAGESFFDSLGLASVPAHDQHVIDDVPKKDVGKLENNLSVENKPTVEKTAVDKYSVAAQVDVSAPEESSSLLLPGAGDISPVQQPSSPIQSPLHHNSEQTSPNPKMEISHSNPFDPLAALWFPSQDTHFVLDAIKSGSVLPKDLKLPNQVAPCIAIDVPQVDPVKELIAKYLGNDEDVKRSMPTEDTVSCNESGLKQLLQAECWRAALNLTAKLLENDGKNNSQVLHSPRSLEIWFCRIALLFQLKMYNIAEVELEAFGNLNSANLYYEFYPALYPGKQGSMVPFCFRILHALIPQHANPGRPKETLDKLFYIHGVCLEVLKILSKGELGGITGDKTNEEHQKGVTLWEERLIQVLYCIGNTFIMLKEYSLAITVFKQIARKDSENSRALLSGIGRISLQSGDIQSAQFYFKSVEDMASSVSSSQTDVLINRGLLALTLDAYEEAYKHFLAAKNIDPLNFVAINNAAVSLLFQGRLKEALELLQDIVLQHPEVNLQEGILFNICTMYELESSHHLQKKQKLLGLVSKHNGDGFNISSLKFP